MAINPKNTTIIIPTYNEAENIASICQEIFSALSKSSSGGKYSNNVKIIIVDDNSQDGTEKIATSLSQKNSQIKFISRKGKTRSFAQSYIDGFKAAIADNADYIIQMDADFSHDPKYLPQMIEKLNNCDLVIGSRYKNGGKVENWPLWRRLLSRSSSFYARVIVGLPLTDPTAGFIGWKSESLKKINLDKISANGYAFLIEMKFHAQKCGLKPEEIPIIFVDRKFGASKMNKKLIIESALFCWKLRFLKK